MQRHARTVISLQLHQRSASSSSSASSSASSALPGGHVAPAWNGVLAWPSDLLTHPSKYRAPPEQAPVAAPAVSAFRNPAFWAEDESELLSALGDSGANGGKNGNGTNSKQTGAASSYSNNSGGNSSGIKSGNQQASGAGANPTQAKTDAVVLPRRREGPPCKYCNRLIERTQNRLL
jgi:hypothetical protein